MISSLPDVTDTEEGRGKGIPPKDTITGSIESWAYIEQVYDCHRRDGELSKRLY